MQNSHIVQKSQISHANNIIFDTPIVLSPEQSFKELVAGVKNQLALLENVLYGREHFGRDDDINEPALTDGRQVFITTDIIRQMYSQMSQVLLVANQCQRTESYV